MKNSFILFTEYYEYIEDLNAEQCGNLMKAIFQFEIEGEYKIELDPTTKIVFKIIKNNLARTNEKYMQSIENGKKGAEYGKLGGRPKTPANPPETPADEKITPSEPLNVNVNKNKNINKNEYVNGNVNEPDGDAALYEPSATVTVTVTAPKDKITFTENQITEYERLYPDIDIRSEIEKIQAEIDGMAVCNLSGKSLGQFIERWLERTQRVSGGKKEKPEQVGGSYIYGKKSNMPDFDDFMRRKIQKTLKFGEFAEPDNIESDGLDDLHDSS